MIEIAPTINFINFATSCFTPRHHEISNKIHDLTTLCASCHECFDCIKTFTHHVVDLTIPATQHFITSSRITSISSRKRHATLYVVTKIYTRIDRWSFRFLLSRLNRNFVLEPCAPLATWIAKIINLLMSSEMSWVVHIKITRAVIWISLDTEYPRCAASPCVALQHVQTYTR